MISLDEDLRVEALDEARRDAFDDQCVTCAGCGRRYDQGYHRASRSEPAYVEVDECPSCGCPDVAEEEGELAPPLDPETARLIESVFEERYGADVFINDEKGEW